MRGYLLALCILTVASGCASKKGPAPSEHPKNALLGTHEVSETTPKNAGIKSDPVMSVATNLASTLVQLDEFPLFSTTIQYSKPETPFAQHVIDAIKELGYGVQQVSEDQGIHYIDSTNTSITTQDGEAQTRFTVSIKDISISRNFDLIDEEYIPASPITVIGSNAQRIVVFDDIFKVKNSKILPSEVIFLNSDGHSQRAQFSVLARSDNALTALSNNTSLEGTSDDEDTLNTAKNSVYQKSELKPKLSKTYHPYKQVSIRFRPGSLSLGENNKRVIRSLKESFSRSKHRFNIAACHPNKSIIWDGDEQPSSDRAKRIQQELLAIKVPIASTYIDPCISSSYSNALSRNTVIITLEISNNFL